MVQDFTAQIEGIGRIELPKDLKQPLQLKRTFREAGLLNRAAQPAPLNMRRRQGAASDTSLDSGSSPPRNPHKTLTKYITMK